MNKGINSDVALTLESKSITIESALSPLASIVWDYNKIKSQFIPELEEKLNKISEDNIITPDLSIAGPAIEAIRFSGHKPEIRNLYANLLSTAMDKNTAFNSHPSFVEIIKQITPDEAKLIKYFSQNSILPIINIIAERRSDFASRIVVRHYSHLACKAGCQYPELCSNYLDNLSRLEIIKVDFDSSYTNKKFYTELLNDSYTLNILNSTPSDDNFVHSTIEGVVNLTDFGKQFIKACL